jgi:hypothetical protein
MLIKNVNIIKKMTKFKLRNRYCHSDKPLDYSYEEVLA